MYGASGKVLVAGQKWAVGTERPRCGNASMAGDDLAVIGNQHRIAETEALDRQMMAAHESPRTTKLYDRTGDEITLDEVERITI